MSVSYYNILGVKPNVGQEEIKEAYRRLMKLHHPDKHGYQDDPITRLISEAYGVLGDLSKRKRYDAERDRTRPDSTPHHSSSKQDRKDKETSFQQAACRQCSGSGRIFAGLCVCGKCKGSGVVYTVSAPAGRQLCRTCGGSGESNDLFSAAGFGGSRCKICDGKGLEPLPKVIGEYACEQCQGFGFLIDNNNPLGQYAKKECDVCYGSGVTSDAPDEIRGFTKELCRDCNGYGYSRTLGPRWSCNRCSGKGWVPGKKF